MSQEFVGSVSALIQRSRRPARSEERELIRRAQNGDEQARRVLIEGNLRLVLYVARRYQSSSLTQEDLLQEGVVGLIDALERYNPSAGHSFSSYAVPWIRLRIGRAVYRMGRLIRVPERSERLLARWHQICEAAQERREPPPSLEEGAAMLGVTPDTLVSMIEASAPTACLYPADGEDEAPQVAEVVADDRAADPLLELLQAEEWKEVRTALAELRPNYRRVLEESYGLIDGEPQTLNDIAHRLGVTKQAVSGLRKRALESLRAVMNLQAGCA